MSGQTAWRFCKARAANMTVGRIGQLAGLGVAELPFSGGHRPQACCNASHQASLGQASPSFN